MTQPTATRHLVTVWNPAYADAMAATIELLLSRAADNRANKLPDDAIYVWWGKVKSTNRQQTMPHLKDILAIDKDLQADDDTGREVHLYVTDYRSLYVAHVTQIVGDDVRKDNDGGVPAFYATQTLDCDCWFQLSDIRRVISDDTLAVVEELRKLDNTRYNDRPISIYGGMVDLPIIATRKDEARWFDADVRGSLTNDQLWVEFDAQRSGVGNMERDLRENLIGEGAWSGLDPAARSFIATAETMFRNHRNDPAFDFGPVIVDFAKAFEVQVNTILRRALATTALKDRSINLDGRSVDITRGQFLSLGALARVLADEEHINRALKKQLANGEWFTASLPPILKDLAERRNAGAHSTRLTAKEATATRNRLMGVGTNGVFVELGRVRGK